MKTTNYISFLLIFLLQQSICQQEQKLFLVTGAAAGLATAISQIATYPLEYLKIKNQGRRFDSNSTNSTTHSGVNSTHESYSKFEAKLFRGVWSSTLYFFVQKTFFFPLYELLKIQFTYQKYGILGYAASTTIGAIISISIAYPWKYINTVQVLSKSDISIGQIIIRTYDNYGVIGFYLGILGQYLTIYGQIVLFITYELLKKLFVDHKYKSHLYFLSGGFSRFFAATMQYPILLVRTQLQANQLKGKSLSYWGIVEEVYHNYGIIGFFYGYDDKIAQSILQAALMFLLYENILIYFKKLFLPEEEQQPLINDNKV